MRPQGRNRGRREFSGTSWNGACCVGGGKEESTMMTKNAMKAIAIPAMEEAFKVDLDALASAVIAVGVGLTVARTIRGRDYPWQTVCGKTACGWTD